MNITFKDWLDFNEGTRVSVKDYDYNKNILNLDDISRELLNYVMENFHKKLTPEEKQARDQSKVQWYDIIAPDGNYKSQTINFYYDGWPPRWPEKMVQGIKKLLDDKKIKYGPFRNETSGMGYGPVVRIPILHFNKTTNAAPEVNMSAGNDRIILHDILGIEFNANNDEIPAAELLMAIQNIDREKIDLHSREYYGVKYPKGGQHHNMGLEPEKIIRHLGELGNLAQWAIQNDYDTLQIS